MYTEAWRGAPLSGALLHRVHGDVVVVAPHGQVRLQRRAGQVSGRVLGTAPCGCLTPTLLRLSAEARTPPQGHGGSPQLPAGMVREPGAAHPGGEPRAAWGPPAEPTDS